MGQNAEQQFQTIMALQGAEALKEAVTRLRTFLSNRAITGADIQLPHYLWSARRGGGVSTLVQAFAEYLHAEQAIEFCGKVRSFEFTLDYSAPDQHFSGLWQLENELSDAAGHRRAFKGVVCIHIDVWVEHTNEAHFKDFLQYVASKSKDILTIFCIRTDDKAKAVDAALATHLRIEALALRFPGAGELADLVEHKYLERAGFTLTKGAKDILTASIAEIASAKEFNGFQTTRQLAQDIVYSVLAAGVSTGRVTAKMLSPFKCDGDYVKRAKTKAKEHIPRVIGFTGEEVPYGDTPEL